MNTLLCAFALLLSTVDTASAAEALGRDLAGRPVTLGAASGPQVLVFWSTRCADCLSPVAALQRAGLDVVLVNTDSAGERAAIAPYLRAHGIEAPVIADPTAAVQRRFGIGVGAVLVDDTGAEALRQVGIVDAVVLVDAAGQSRMAHR